MFRLFTNRTFMSTTSIFVQSILLHYFRRNILKQNPDIKTNSSFFDKKNLNTIKNDEKNSTDYKDKSFTPLA